VVAGILVLVGLAIGLAAALVDDDSTVVSDVGVAPEAVPPVSVEAVEAVESYRADPRAETMRRLLSSIGGVEAVARGEVEGAFDLVRFDPLNPDRLLAVRRSSYGRAENQDVNELWEVDSDGVTRRLWDQDTPHDFAHFNVDGTITMWVSNQTGESYGPRIALQMANDGRPIIETEPMFASRFTASGGSVFALTGDGDYYSDTDSYQQLVVDGAIRTVLDSGADYSWIDNPVPELLVAYPRSLEGVTAVWDSRTVQRLDRHPLAGRPYQRVSVSGDRKTAVGVDFDGRMEQLDLESGAVLGQFGSVQIGAIDQPLTLNGDGTLAITVERSGQVSLWWVGDDTPLAVVAAGAAQPRWVWEQHGARAASAVAADASRIALRYSAQPGQSVRWLIVDTTVEAWIEHACAYATPALAELDATSC